MFLRLAPVFISRAIAGQKTRAILGKPPGNDGLPHLGHQAQDKAQVVQGCQTRPQHLPCLEQMAQVSGGVIPAGVAVAIGIQGRILLGVPAVGNVNPPVRREQRAVAGHAGRQHAVKQIHALRHAVDQIFRRAHAHQVARFVVRQPGADLRRYPMHLRLGFAHRQAADGIAVKRNARNKCSGFLSQFRYDAALHDAE